MPSNALRSPACLLLQGLGLQHAAVADKCSGVYCGQCANRGACGQAADGRMEAQLPVTRI